MIQDLEGEKDGYSALIHTVDPQSKDLSVSMIEFIPGGGRTLTDPNPKLQGEPFRYYFDKKSEEVITADDPRKQFHPVMATKKYSINALTGEIEPLDYRRYQDIATEEGRLSLAKEIGIKMQRLEQYWGRPMDVEMVIAKTSRVAKSHPDYVPGDFVYMSYTVQARPQAHFDPFAGSYQFDIEEKKRVDFLQRWIQEYGEENIKDLGFIDGEDHEKVSAGQTPDYPDSQEGSFMDSLGNYLDWEQIIKTIATNPLFESVREGILRRLFFYARYRHQVLVNLLRAIEKKDPELFEKIFIYTIPPFRYGPYLEQHPESLTVFFERNQFLLARLSMGSREEIIEAAPALPSLALVDLANQMINSEYGGSPRSVAEACLKILAKREDVSTVRDLLDGWLKEKLDHLSSNKAMLNTRNGGIDLKGVHMDVKLDSGSPTKAFGDDRGIQFHMNAAMLQQLKNAPGFIPVIINIQPLRNLRKFLGIHDLTQGVV